MRSVAQQLLFVDVRDRVQIARQSCRSDKRENGAGKGLIVS